MTKVAIGMPVYNGASMLGESLETVAGQSHRDIEIIVGDNASTDETPQICADMAARDDRVRVIRRPENLGPLGNFRNLLDRTDAPYFLWRSYDDLSNPDYIAQLLARLEAAPDAVLAAPHVETLRMATGKRRPRPVAGLDGASASRVLRVSQGGWIYGLWRREALIRAFDRAVPAIHPHVWAWDHLALFPAILRGQVVFANEARLVLRLNHAIAKERLPDQAAVARDLTDRYRAVCFDLIDEAGLTGLARQRMRWAVRRHIHRRVAPLQKRLF